MSRIIATLQEPELAAKMMIRRSEPGYYEIFTRYDNGNTSTEWKRVGELSLRNLLNLHFGLRNAEIDSILSA